jgi:hypothetical protein
LVVDLAERNAALSNEIAAMASKLDELADRFGIGAQDLAGEGGRIQQFPATPARRAGNRSAAPAGGDRELRQLSQGESALHPQRLPDRARRAGGPARADLADPLAQRLARGGKGPGLRVYPLSGLRAACIRTRRPALGSQTPHRHDRRRGRQSVGCIRHPVPWPITCAARKGRPSDACTASGIRSWSPPRSDSAPCPCWAMSTRKAPCCPFWCKRLG